MLSLYRVKALSWCLYESSSKQSNIFCQELIICAFFLYIYILKMGYNFCSLLFVIFVLSFILLYKTKEKLCNKNYLLIPKILFTDLVKRGSNIIKILKKNSCDISFQVGNESLIVLHASVLFHYLRARVECGRLVLEVNGTVDNVFHGLRGGGGGLVRDAVRLVIGVGDLAASCWPGGPGRTVG